MKVYIADNIPDAHLASALLKRNGIPNKVINENLVAAYGEIPPGMDTLPAVVVFKKEHYEKAIAILSENVKGFKPPETYRSLVDLAVEKVLKNPAPFLAAGIILVLILLLLVSVLA